MSRVATEFTPLKEKRLARPRVGFLGLGWIGRSRMESIAQSGLVEIAAVSDVAEQAAADASQRFPDAKVVDSFESLVEVGLDGIVIATPSALHAEQAAEALARGMAVFCQKPLGRTQVETAQVIEVARQNDQLLGVDLSYRFITCLRHINQLCLNNDLGEIYAVDLMFHNAYGPDKPWFYDEKLSGGGCVID